MGINLKNIPPFVIYFLKLYFGFLVVFLLFRLSLLTLAVINWERLEPMQLSEVLQALLIGLQFDSVILSYTILIPFIIISIFILLKKESQRLYKVVSVYWFVVALIFFLILSADIPYFLHFYQRISVVSLIWLKDIGFASKMILNEPSFFSYLLLLAVLIYFSFRFLKRLTPKKDALNTTSIKTTSLILIIVLPLLVLGMRGRISAKSPIQIGSSYFCNHSLLNVLGMNPVFSFFYTTLKPNVLDAKCPIPDFEYIKSKLKLEIGENQKPLQCNSIENKPAPKNLVIVIMESMGSFKLGKYNGPEGITPHLSKLIDESIYFENTFTAGIHTFNGIYSTLFSNPALHELQPFEELLDIQHDGIGTILKKHQFNTIYFSSHDGQFNNVEGFLRNNGFQEFYSDEDYPEEWVLSSNGIPDHLLFEFAKETFDKQTKPFLGVIMTSSDHKPYIIPEKIDFKPTSESMNEKIVEYADWSIGKFIYDSKTSNWFDNTLFVFIADHGLNMGHTYDMPLSFHHTPLLFYSPNYLTPKKHSKLALQIDVIPTALNIMDISYCASHLGVNLLKETREYAYFSADNKIGCLDSTHYLILRDNGIETLYQYENLSTHDYIDDFPQKVKEMKKYTTEMLKTYQYLISQKKSSK